MTRRYVLAALALLALVFAFSWWTEHHQAPGVELAVAHERSRSDSVVAAKAETVFVAQKAVAAAARVEYRAAVARPAVHDTVWLKGALAKADTVIALDSVALADAGRAIEASNVEKASLRSELAIASRPQTATRFGTTITALYDPVGASPLLSAAMGFRVIGKVSLVAVAFQRVEIGATPRVFFGLSVRL